MVCSSLMGGKEQLDESRMLKLQELQAAGVNPYPYTFRQTHHATEINEKYATLKPGDHTTDSVRIA